jgi:hypothetical protein
MRPQYENLRGDPRWKALTKRVGLSDEQLAAIGYDPQLPE